MAGNNVRSYHKPHPKPKTIVDLQETLQMIWGSLSASETDRQNCKEVFEVTKGFFKTKGGHFEHSQ